jgi:hypothetical protein
MFANHPEMYISSLLCEAMDDNEAIYFLGFKKYFKNTGYSYQTKYAGKESGISLYEYKKGVANEHIVAIDAI